MSTQTLTAFEKIIISGLAYKAGIAAVIFDSWSELPERSLQTERSLIDLAQLGVTEEHAVRELLDKSVELRLLDSSAAGYQPRSGAHSLFKRLAFALNTIEYYVSTVHRDATTTRVVLTKPPNPSVLEQKLSELGWRVSELEETHHAFHSMVRAAQGRVVIMTPFFDQKGALWLQELVSFVQPDVKIILILRSLEDESRSDYPDGYDAILHLVRSQRIRVYNYSVPRVAGCGRETFHAKVVLCDRNVAYVGSSNLNTASLEHSMEVGVVLQGRAAADVATVLDAVINASVPWV